MKKTFSILPMLMMIGIAALANRTENPSMAVVENGSTIKVFYKTAKNTDVKILILNDNNQIIFSESMKDVSGFMRPYNFSKLPEGNYSIKVRDFEGVQVKQVQYKEKKNEKIAHLMRIEDSNEKLLLAVPNKGKDIITVTIYNGDQEVLYSGKEIIEGDFAKVYNLREFQGNITFVVTDSHGSTKTLTKSLE